MGLAGWIEGLELETSLVAGRIARWWWSYIYLSCQGVDDLICAGVAIDEDISAVFDETGRRVHSSLRHCTVLC